MCYQFHNLHTISFYTLLESCLSIDDIVKFAVDNKLTHAILTDKNLCGSMEFYNKCKKNKIIPVIGLDLTIENSRYVLIAKNHDGFKQLTYIHSCQNINKNFDINNEVKDLIVIHVYGSHIIKSKEYYLANEIAFNTARMIDESDIDTFKVLRCIENNDIELSEINVEHDYLLNINQARKIFSEEKIRMTNELVNKCVWEIPQCEPMHLANFKCPNNLTQKEYLHDLCLIGLKKKFNTTKIEKKYIDRLLYELKIIHDMGYDNYFLIVQDFVNYAHKNKILIGPGRGSAAGSLVSFCLNITNVDPLSNNLIFERFLNPERKSMPDIDIDVMDTRRQELIDYIFDKYGPQNTSYIITFQRIKAKMAIRDVGRILKINNKTIDRISKELTPDEELNLELCANSKELANDFKEYPELFRLANRLINIPRQISTHAAGIIICDQPIYNYAPVQLGIDEWQLCEYTMDQLEPLGLIKMDILGLKNLSIIDDILKLIRINKSINVDLHKINYNDEKVFDDICLGDTIGIFQLESPGMTSTIKKIKPRNIEDISICSALYRPGPQALIPNFVKTRNKTIPERYLNRDLESILKPTLGFCIYQEQVIELIRVVANFSLGQADVFRRAISKKKIELFEQMKKEFIDSAVKNNYSEKDAQNIYSFILEFANYGFNHSHSLAYSYISFQMMYLKHYYPLEFYMTLLSYGDPTKNNLYLSKAKQSGIKILNVSITKSNINFSIYNDMIIFGFMNIKGIGIEIAKRIFETKSKYKFETAIDAISILGRQDGISKKTIEILIKVGVFDEFNMDRNFLLINLDQILKRANIAKQDINLFDPRISNEYEPMSEQEKAEHEFNYLSYTFSNNEWDKYFIKYEKQYNIFKIKESKNYEHDNFLIKINQIKNTMTKFGKKMSFIEFSENGIDYSCACFSETLFSKLKINKYAIVKLKMSNGKIQINDVITIIED